MNKLPALPPDAAAATAAAAMRDNMYLLFLGMFSILSPGNRLDEAPYIEAMCFALQEVAEGRNRRLIISIAPRHLKSLCASVLFPAFLLGLDPTRKIVVVSYGSDLARDHAETFRRLLESEAFRRLFPGTRLDPRHNRIESMRTTAGGYRMAVSREGALTGFGADVIVLDDLIKAGDAGSPAIREKLRTFFDETAHSRMNSKRSSAIVSVQQRLHADDITAYLLEKRTFSHLCLPSIAEGSKSHPLYRDRRFVRSVGEVLSPARESREVLDDIRREIGSYAFQAQYQQDPRPGVGEFLALEDLAVVDTLPPTECFVRRVQSWDTAAKDGPRCDFSVGLTFGWHRDEEVWYLLDVHRERLDYTSLKETILRQRKAWHVDKVLIEDSALGSALLPDLRKTAAWVFHGVSPSRGKIDRFLPATDWIKARKLRIPADAPWFVDFRRELLGFPHDTYDDQVDALSQFAAWVRRAQNAYLDTDPATGRRIGNYRPPRPRPADRMQF